MDIEVLFSQLLGLGEDVINLGKKRARGRTPSPTPAAVSTAQLEEFCARHMVEGLSGRTVVEASKTLRALGQQVLRYEGALEREEAVPSLDASDITHLRSRLRQVHTKRAAVHSDRAHAWARVGRWGKAIDDYTASLEIASVDLGGDASSGMARYYASRGNAFGILRRFGAAVEDCTCALGLLFPDAQSSSGVGGLSNAGAGAGDNLSSDGSTDEAGAMPRYANVSAANKTLAAQVFTNRGVAFRLRALSEAASEGSEKQAASRLSESQKEDLERALADFAEAAALDPTDSAPPLNASLVNRKLGRWTKVVSNLTEALQLNAAMRRHRRSIQQRHQENQEQHLPRLDEDGNGEGGEPKYDDAHAFCSRGAALGKLGDLDGALRDFNAAVRAILHRESFEGVNDDESDLGGMPYEYRPESAESNVDSSATAEAIRNVSEEGRTALISALSNRAIAHRQRQDWEAVLRDTTSVHVLLEQSSSSSSSADFSEDADASARSQATNLTTRGMAFVRLRRLDKAVEDFSVALDLVFGVEGGEERLSSQAQNLLINRSTANMQLRKWTAVVDDATTLLLAFEEEDHDARLQVLRHRATAYRELENTSAALEDTDMLVALTRRSTGFSRVGEAERNGHMSKSTGNKSMGAPPGEDRVAAATSMVAALAMRTTALVNCEDFDGAKDDIEESWLVLAEAVVAADESAPENNSAIMPTKSASVTTTTRLQQQRTKLQRMATWVDEQEALAFKQASAKADQMARLLLEEEGGRTDRSTHQKSSAASRNEKKKKQRRKREAEGTMEPVPDLDPEGSKVAAANDPAEVAPKVEFEANPETGGALETNKRSNVERPRQASPSSRAVYERVFNSVLMMEASKEVEDEDPATPMLPRRTSTSTTDRLVLRDSSSPRIDGNEIDSGIGNKESADTSIVRQGKLIFDRRTVLGRGSFGTIVHSGKHSDWGAVAVKVMPKTPSSTSSDASGLVGGGGGGASFSVDESVLAIIAETAIAERNIHAMISRNHVHPNVVRYFGVEEDQQNYYLAMEQCAFSLHDLISSSTSSMSPPSPMVAAAPTTSSAAGFLNAHEVSTPEEARRISGELVLALQFLHTTVKVVHGDLRPKNVLFSVGASAQGASSHQESHVKLGDFGLARQLHDDASFSWAHGGPTGMGGWFAPEVYRQQRKTAAVDIFSLGCIIFYILTEGQHPFDGDPFRVVDGKHNLVPLLIGDHSATFPASSASSRTKHLRASGKRNLCGNRSREAMALIEAMLQPVAEARPLIVDIARHPFLWEPKEQLEYIENIANKHEHFKEQLSSIFIDSLVSNGALSDWMQVVDRVLVLSMTRFRGYDGKSVLDLIRFIRNMNQHLMDQTPEALEVLGTSRGAMSAAQQRGLLARYITEKFPGLIMELWLRCGETRDV